MRQLQGGDADLCEVSLKVSCNLFVCAERSRLNIFAKKSNFLFTSQNNTHSFNLPNFSGPATMTVQFLCA